MAHEPLGKYVTDVLTTFLSLLTEQIHSNMQSVILLLYNKEVKRFSFMHLSFNRLKIATNQNVHGIKLVFKVVQYIYSISQSKAALKLQLHGV